MREEDLKRIEQEIIGAMNKQQNLEEMIVNLSEEIAAKLSLNNKATADVDDTQYAFAYQVVNNNKKRILYMTVADMRKFQILQEAYRPYTLTAEIDNDLSLRENLKATVEAFLRHVYDMVEAEEL